MLKLFKRILNARLTREIWVNTYVEAISDGNDTEFSKVAADNAVLAYNQKFVKVKINLK